MKKFNNIPNTPHKVGDTLVWHSRGTAVCAHIICVNPTTNKYYYLIGKRGDKLEYDPNLYNIVGGYIDWNENLKNATIREVYEETGFDISNINADSILYSKIKQPYFVDTEPNTKLQNIIFHTLFICKLTDLPILTTKYAEPGEVDTAEWISFDKIHEINDWAFNHKELIPYMINQIRNLI
jgi:8-oxo-dGTP pyrophosphatase MutT (NUDIX family)